MINKGLEDLSTGINNTTNKIGQKVEEEFVNGKQDITNDINYACDKDCLFVQEEEVNQIKESADLEIVCHEELQDVIKHEHNEEDIPADDKDACSEKIRTAGNDDVKQNGGDNPMSAENVEMTKIVEKEGIKSENELKWSS